MALQGLEDHPFSLAFGGHPAGAVSSGEGGSAAVGSTVKPQAN